MFRVGMLTSGGDCQALNATMRAIYLSATHNAKEPIEFYGFRDGYKGLMYSKYTMLHASDFEDILTRGGTILGTSRVPFKDLDKPDEYGKNKVEMMKKTYHELGLDVLFVLGGNGSIKTANRLSQEGLNIISMPKTIDNDLWGTDMTFGFQSAVDIATRAIDEIHTTASSHGRVFIVEIMGHKTGWLPLNAGIAGGADIILLPEIPYRLDSIIKTVQRKKTNNHGSFMILAVAEGAISVEDKKLSKKEYRNKLKNYIYPSVSYKLAAEIEEATGKEVRVTIPGHTQRGGMPDAYDRVFASRLGSEGGRMACNGEYGFMVAYRNREIVKVPLSEAAGKLKLVDPNSSIIKEARMLGISFGDED
ncbi:MAG: 6-phosphofructokinase [Allobaculum sp.]